MQLYTIRCPPTNFKRFSGILCLYSTVFHTSTLMLECNIILNPSLKIATLLHPIFFWPLQSSIPMFLANFFSSCFFVIFCVVSQPLSQTYDSIYSSRVCLLILDCQARLAIFLSTPLFNLCGLYLHYKISSSSKRILDGLSTVFGHSDPSGHLTLCILPIQNLYFCFSTYFSHITVKCKLIFNCNDLARHITVMLIWCNDSYLKICIFDRSKDYRVNANDFAIAE